jgi:hypothetical protein
MLLFFLAACAGKSSDTGVHVGDTDTQETEGGCSEDGDCGGGEICEEDACVDGDRDNTADAATALLWDESAEGVLNPDDDVDWYSFEADGGEYIRVLTTVADSEDYDTVVTIRKSNGKVVTSADGYATGTTVTGEDAVAFAYLEEAGTYTIEVEDIGTASGVSGYGDPEYTYTVSLEQWSDRTSESDSAEDPGIVLSLADARVWNAVGSVIDPEGDADFIGITHLLDGQNLYVDGNQDLTGSDLTPLVRLWDESGTLLGEKQDVGPDEYLFYPHLPAGDYVVEVTDASGGGGSNAWFFTHVIVREDYDGYAFTEESEPDDSLDTATALPTTVYQNGSGADFRQAQGLGWIDTGSDEDWFVVEDTYAGGGIVVCLASSAYGSLVAPTVELWNGDGTLLASAVGNANTFPTAFLDDTDTDGTPRYVRVTGDVSGPGAWYRFYVYAASFSIASYADGGYGCP